MSAPSVTAQAAGRLAWDAAAPAAVRVFERDPELLAGIEDAAAALLRRRVVTPLLSLGRGPWAAPAQRAQAGDGLGLLVLSGLLTRTIRPHGFECAELLGSGDLLQPWEQGSSATEIPGSWRVLQPTTLAVLDARFAIVTGRWPSIAAALLGRSALRLRGLALHLAIAHVRQADRRLLLLLWHLAERWGRVTPDGVALPLPLTHELLGRLVCLHRPTTSAALQRLAAAGEVARRPGGGWLLLGEPPREDVAEPVGVGA